MPKNTTIMDCFTCGPIEAYSQQANDFAGNLSSALQGPMSAIFLSLAGLWVVWSGYKLIFAKTDLVKIGEEFIYVILASVLLSVQGPRLISSIYRLSLSIMGSAAEAIFLAAGGSSSGGKYTGVVALAAQAEASISKIFAAVETIIQLGSTFDIMNYVYAALLIIPYFLLLITFSAQVVVSIFRVMMVATFAPFLFLSFAFGWSRQMAVSGVKTLLSTAMVLFASTAALAVGLYGVDHLLADTSTMTAKQIAEYVSFSNPTFLAAIFLGWLGTAFQAEGTSIANSISGTVLTNDAATIITAGVAGSAYKAAKAGGKVFAATEGGSQIIKGAKAALNLPGIIGEQAGRNLSGGKTSLERFKEVFNPPPSSPPPPPPPPSSSPTPGGKSP